MKPYERDFSKTKNDDWCSKGKKGRKKKRHAARHKGKLQLKKEQEEKKE